MMRTVAAVCRGGRWCETLLACPFIPRHISDKRHGRQHSGLLCHLQNFSLVYREDDRRRRRIWTCTHSRKRLSGSLLHTLIRSTYSTSCNALDWRQNRLYHRPIRLRQLRIKLDAHQMWSAIVQMATSLCTATRISFDVTWLVFFFSISTRLFIFFFFKYFVSLSPALCICCSRT